jgi:hypothetical protein
MIYDMFGTNLILIKNIKEIKFEKFCMMAFVGFCLWILNKLKNKGFSKIYKLLIFFLRLLLWTHVKNQDL